jgi:hypothetical protein
MQLVMNRRSLREEVNMDTDLELRTDMLSPVRRIVMAGELLASAVARPDGLEEQDRVELVGTWQGAVASLRQAHLMGELTDA